MIVSQAHRTDDPCHRTYVQQPDDPADKSCGGQYARLQPIVRETGGLKDTVEPYNEYESKGTGFSFANYNAHEMLSAVRYAEQIYYDKKREWNKIVDRAMAADFSWEVSANKSYKNPVSIAVFPQ